MHPSFYLQRKRQQRAMLAAFIYVLRWQKTCSNYYPFGLRMPGRSMTSATPTKEDFTGHEFDFDPYTMTGTRLHYAGARYYMSAFGRWMTSDPILSGNPKALLEQDGRLLSMSPYNYAYNNPLLYIDPTGMFGIFAGDDCPECVNPDDPVVLPEVNVTARRIIDQERFAFTQFARLDAEGVGLAGSYNVIGAVRVLKLNENDATLYVGASGFTAASGAGRTDWFGTVSVSGNSAGGNNEIGPFEIPLLRPSEPSFSNSTRDLIGTATFTVPRTSSLRLQLTTGYKFVVPGGRFVPVPWRMTRTLPIPEIVFRGAN